MVRTTLGISLALFTAGTARADTVWVRSASAGGAAVSLLEIKDVRINGVTDGKLRFESAGRQSSRELAQVARVQIDDEPALSAAETALAANQLDAAADGYRKVLAGTTKEWVKTWSAQRLLELQGRQGGDKGAAATAQQLPQSSAPATVAGGAIAKVNLDAAAAALKANDFAKAKAEIDANRRAFLEPADQAQALFYLAEAQAGLANQANDPAAWKDTALAYMRVVAHFPDGPTASLAAQSLLKTAQIEQKLNDLEAAKALYQQLAAQYPADPSAAAAKTMLEQLKK